MNAKLLFDRLHKARSQDPGLWVETVKTAPYTLLGKSSGQSQCHPGPPLATHRLAKIGA